MQNHGKSVFDMDANLVALLCYVANFVCYLGLVLSIITLIQDKTNKLARFHAWQSILLFIAPIVLLVVWGVFAFIGVFIDAAIGIPIFSIISMLLYFVLILAGLAVLVGMIIAAIKGFNGEIFKLPIIGNFADRFSN
ncbi:MAG: hypothetical protein IPM25_16955 [Chloracidobacterium sp.]|nr:hypothetical protein [Chloracidobacterium sp.]